MSAFIRQRKKVRFLADVISEYCRLYDVIEQILREVEADGTTEFRGLESRILYLRARTAKITNGVQMQMLEERLGFRKESVTHVSPLAEREDRVARSAPLGA
jgi:hypothetical protein